MTKKNPETVEQPANERRAEFAKRMHIMRAWNGSYHVLEIPGSDGEAIKAWPGPFNSMRAAELLLEDMIEPYAEGNLGTAFCPLGLGRGDLIANYEREGELVKLIEEHGGVSDPRGLARLLMQKQPWHARDAEIPF